MRNAVEALAAGFRPCLLCRPDRLPDLGLEQPVSEVAHALRLIADGYLDRANTEQLADKIGYSARQLVRLFEKHVGASPDFVARARRAHLARRLLDESNLTIAGVAFAAGFSSVRQMNRVMSSMFGFTPSKLRAKRSRGDALEPLDGGLRLRVPYAGPLAVTSLIDFMGGRAIPGVESVQDGSYRRTMNTCGYPGVVEVRDAAGSQNLEVTMHLATFGSILDEVGRVRSLFRLDVDDAAARRHLRRDRWLGTLARRLRGVRLPGAWDGFETAVRIIVGQQVSVSGASTTTGRLAERFGERIELPLPGGLRQLFPEAQTLAKAQLRHLGMPKARGRALRGFARAVASGDIDLHRSGSLDECVSTLQRLEGIGPWTAHLIAGRVMGQPDAFPSSDLGLRKAASALVGASQLMSARELEELSQAWRPFRSTAVAYLWMAQQS